MTQIKLHATLGLLALSVLATTQPVAAQPVPDAGTVLDSVKETPPPRKPDEPVLDSQVPSPSPSAGASDQTVLVKAFRFEGNSVVSEAELQALVADYVNQAQTLDALNEAAETIKAHYRSKQYFLAQAILPAQDIRDGIVTMQIIEGRLGKARVSQGSAARLKPGRAAAFMDTLLPSGSLITETGIEKPLLLLNDLPGVTVRSTLRPGAEVGEADLDVLINDEGRTLTGDVQLDNWGNRNTGRTRLTGSMSARNLTGYGDLLTLRGLVAEDKGTLLGHVGYTVPVGSRGTKITASYSALEYELGEAFASLDADGDARIASLQVFHPLLRSRNSNLFALGGYDNKRLRDRQFDGTVEDERSLDNFWLGVSGDFRDDLGGGSLNTYSAALTRGDVDIETAITLDPYRTEGSFTKLNLSFQRLQAIVENTALLMSLSGQLANKNLSSVELMTLGGPRGVRGYPVGEAAGDDAVLGTLELRQLIPSLRPFGGTLQVSAFADFGYVKLHHDPLPTDILTSRSLASYGVGVNLGKQGDYLFRVDVAFRGDDEAEDDDRSARVWAQLIKWF